MNSVYTKLSEVYDAMYKTFINYREELDFYSSILIKYNCTSVLEIGCGTGNLAPGFNALGLNYCGLDFSNEMLKIATTNHPECRFIQGDMKNFRLDEKQAACIITGRTTSYLVTNMDVTEAFKAINKNLLPGGIFCFDCIDANKFIPLIKDGLHITHKASYENKKFGRDSYWQPALQQNCSFNWQAVYYRENENGRQEKIGEDDSILRAFCKDEIILFLALAGFRLKELINRPSYAFDTFVIVAEKI